MFLIPGEYGYRVKIRPLQNILDDFLDGMSDEHTGVRIWWWVRFGWIWHTFYRGLILTSAALFLAVALFSVGMIVLPENISEQWLLPGFDWAWSKGWLLGLFDGYKFRSLELVLGYDNMLWFFSTWGWLVIIPCWISWESFWERVLNVRAKPRQHRKIKRGIKRRKELGSGTKEMGEDKTFGLIKEMSREWHNITGYCIDDWIDEIKNDKDIEAGVARIWRIYDAYMSLCGTDNVEDNKKKAILHTLFCYNDGIRRSGEIMRALVREDLELTKSEVLEVMTAYEWQREKTFFLE